ncbi:MAG: hypothetical protein WAK82_30375 [Streptosporangiaceae bacterium]
MEPIETIAWHGIIDQGELDDWRGQLACLGCPGPWPKASPTAWTGTKSPRWHTAAADCGSR